MNRTLEAASESFDITCKTGEPTFNRTDARVEKVYGPLRTTLTLLQDGDLRICLVASDFPTITWCFSHELRKRLADVLNVPISHVWNFASHNHSVPLLERNGFEPWDLKAVRAAGRAPTPDLLPTGRRLLQLACRAARSLPQRLEPVTVWWALGHESRISYNRKGRRADGTTFFMREEDRLRYGRDFRGDIDTHAPVVCLKSRSGRPVAFLAQFAAHPVTSYRPEHPIVHGDYPRTACDLLARRFSNRGQTVPVSFLQGCCGDVNAKGMLTGGPRRAEQFGRHLGQTYRRAAMRLQPSRRGGMDAGVQAVPVPLSAPPPARVLHREIDEIEDFIVRANAGDENTLECVGLNFPRALTPRYRARLVEWILPWNRWALRLHESGRSSRVPRHLDVEVHTLRLGDVGIVGLSCEPFQGIGRLIRQGSPLPLTIPCGYVNHSHCYITDSPNTGDREYMSACYRYTRYRLPLKKPAGDVLARAAVRMLRGFCAD